MLKTAKNQGFGEKISIKIILKRAPLGVFFLFEYCV